MDRKQFLATTTAAAGMAALSGCTSSPSRKTAPSVGEIGGRSLEQLREQYRADLFDRFLPSMDRYVVDHEYGGFMTNVDIESGEQLSTDKRAWYEGRGMWTYAFLYNKIDPNPSWLEVAQKSRDFIMQHQPSDGNFWTSSFSREGEPLTAPGDDNPWITEEGDIYGNLFIAEGLYEISLATGDSQERDLAKKMILDCFSRYENPEYRFHINYLSPDAPEIPGTRVLGHWMIFLRSATQILEQEEDPQIEELADRCVDAIMNHHMNSGYHLLNEGLNHDMTLPENAFAQFSYLGHGIETLWMVMFEAARRRDRELFDRSREAFRHHIEVARDAVYGGFFRSLDHVDEYRWKVDKVLWLQEEVLIGTLFLMEHTGDEWAEKTFSETDAYVRSHFADPDYKFWIHAGDRTLEEYPANRAEQYHHPRHLMLNLLAVERMLERNGELSGLFA